ncbi:hypothetical protein MPSEU_000740500 [Mayamaea pseudoterrestris]|nr:hypothetical protein MPSEU_000740500 [Mayamaea pseudoterrestris]
MKISMNLALLVASASAFAPRQPTFTSSTSSSALYAEQSRQQFLAQSAAAAMATFAMSAQPAFAAKYGGFGAGSPNVLDPTSADIDQDVLKSGDVQQAIKDIRSFQSKVQSMKASLQSDPEANLKSTLIKEFDFAKLRATLNTYNKAFEEDTQRGTDRLIRVIMQDITELDLAATQKAGLTRSEKRLTAMNGKLNKLDQAFDDLLAFVK